jgi:hypothetical protein
MSYHDTRTEVLKLMRNAGCYDMRTVTLMHRRLGVDDKWHGRPVDQWLDSLDPEQMRIVEHRLRQQA